MTEEITLPRQIVLDLVRHVYERRPTRENPALTDALETIANAGAKQGYRTGQWLVDARAVWVLAHVVDVRALYEPGEALDVALIIQNGVRAALERDAPTTCRTMQRLVALGDVTLDQPDPRPKENPCPETASTRPCPSSATGSRG